MKAKIISSLRGHAGVISGAALSADLGVSRVTIWKHIRKLQELGYPIEATSKGYRLKGEADFLYPWEMGTRARLIHHYDSVGSTMDVARDLARRGCAHMSVVVAEAQTQGRGRLQRQWHSSRGGLFFTLVLRPAIAPTASPKIGLAAALFLSETLQAHWGLPAQVKWPNDVLINGCKVAGMLAEMEAEADRVTFINIGLGINVNNALPDDVPHATSLKAEFGQPLSRKDVLLKYLDAVEQGLASQRLEGVLQRWKKNCVTIGRDVRVETLQATVSGRAVDLDDHGALVVQTPDKKRVHVFYGDCFHL
jgi:BirA family biotin operon repressor/biotin-[acetyl-CoA-carboxylase] ligase